MSQPFFRSFHEDPAIRERRDQFVKSIWHEFELAYPTEDFCWSWLNGKLREKDALFCHKCFSKSLKFKDGYRKFRCSKCHSTSSLSAGTFFAGVRKLRAWLGAMWLLERGALVNSLMLADLSGLRISSAQHILKSLLAAVDLSEKDREERVCISSAHFLDLFSRRSLATPRWLRPFEEEVYEGRLHSRISSKSNDHGESAEKSSENAYYKVRDFDNHSADDPECSKPSDIVESCFSDDKQRELAFSLLAVLGDRPLGFDDLCEVLGRSISDISAVMTELQIEGLIEELAGLKFSVVKNRVSNASSFDNDSAESEDTGSFWEGEDQEFKGPDYERHVYFDGLENGDVHASWRSADLRYERRDKLSLTKRAIRKCLADRCLFCQRFDGEAALRLSLEAFKAGINFIFGGISRKYLQIYSSALRFIPGILDESDGSEAVLHFLKDESRNRLKLQLLDNCLRTGYIGSRKLRAFTSPMTVEIPLSF